MPQPIATWNPARDVWETEPESLFCGHLAVFSETFVTSGSMRGGMAFALPTWVQHTTDSASSSSPSVLPTPNTMDQLPPRSDEALARAKASGGCSNLKDHPLVRQAKYLSVPTPIVADAGASGGSTPSDVTLTDLAVRMDFGARENPLHS